jgi:hypothetical protein
MSNNSLVDFGFDLPEHKRFQAYQLKKNINQTQQSNQSQFGSLGAAASFAYAESLY